MRIAGAVRLGVLALVLAPATACGSAGDAPPPTDSDAAVPSYEAPVGAPPYCTRLASLVELGRLPTSVGTLAAGTDTGASAQVSGAMRELLAVLSDVRTTGGADELASALDELVGSLGDIRDRPLTDERRAAVADGLSAVDVQPQPTCRFPT